MRDPNSKPDPMKFFVQFRTGTLTSLEDVYALDDHFASLLSPGGFKCVNTSWRYGIRVLEFRKDVVPNGEV